MAQHDDRIWLLCGDLGYSVLERFASQFPERFVNMGVAEQNMTGVAAGLALSGKTVVTYSIANFPVMRCLEQIRNDVCYHAANVKIVAVGGGMAYGTAGYTHHGIEDLAVMRALPGMTVIAPGDPVETRLATQAVIQTPGPCYLRLGKGGEPTVHAQPPTFQIGKAITVREGTDAILITTGSVLPEVTKAADVLVAQGVSAGVLSMPSIQPIDSAAILSAARHARLLFTVEEHAQFGGLGSAVAEVLSASDVPHGPMLHAYVRGKLSTVGSLAYLRQVSGLDAQTLVETVTAALA